MSLSALVLLGALFWSLPGIAGEAPDFQELLKEGGLSFTPAAGFRPLPVAPDYVLPYEARYVTADGGLEVRYAIRPLRRVEIDYRDPHNAAPSPNDLFNMLFRALGETLAKDHEMLSRTYPPSKARRDYNAGWAAAGVFDISPDVSSRYHQGMLFAIHQNDKADAYLFFLTNDLNAEKARIQRARTSLRFQRFDEDIHRPPSPTQLKQLPMIREDPPR